MSEKPDKFPEWLRLYVDEYWTLDEVAKLEGITREGVRQRLLKLDITPRPQGETNSLRELREISKQSEAIKQAFLDTRSMQEIADEFDFPLVWIQRFIQSCIPDFEVLGRVPRNAAKRYSADDLLKSLRESALLSSDILTTAAYDVYAKTHPKLNDGRPRPGKQAMFHRFGSWREALEAANLPANPTAGPKKTFDEAASVRAVVDCWRSIGRPPTADAYDKWQRAQAGYPSTATVRNRAGSWNILLVRVWQIVHGKFLDQDDIDVTVPKPLLSGENESKFGLPFVEYRAADEGTEVSLRSDMIVDGYQALERAVQSHAIIQNSVAKAAVAAGLKPWAPTFDGPMFDIVLSQNDEVVFVVEVKSATTENLEFQLRIGLGQVLRYAHQLESNGCTVVPVIAIERCPDTSWKALLMETGVGLIVLESISEDLAFVVNNALVKSQSVA